MQVGTVAIVAIRSSTHRQFCQLWPFSVLFPTQHDINGLAPSVRLLHTPCESWFLVGSLVFEKDLLLANS